MRPLKIILALGLISLVHASRLYVSSYSGNVTTVELTEKADGVQLEATFQSQGCAPSPSWLEYNGKTPTLFCADEGFSTPNKANFTSFKVESDGSLTLLDRVTTLNGGVNTVTYMSGADKLMAVAHYGGSGISIINTTDPSALNILKTYVFTFGSQVLLPLNTGQTKPSVPFIHQVVVDPTGKFLLAPDLSADQTHVFGFTEDGMLTDPPGQMPLLVHEGSGPRHLVFYRPTGADGKTYLYLVMETMNMLHGYEVVYTATGTMEFKNVYMNTIFGGDALPVGSAAAEIKLTSDNKYLIVSSRSDKLSLADPSNSTSLSDTLVTFSLDPQTGIPELLEKSSAGGLGPRSFAINNAGDRVAVALNGQNKLVIFKRNVETGKFAGQIGSLNLDIGAASGLVSNVVWAEEDIDKVAVQSSTQGPSLSVGSTASTATTDITILVTQTVTLSGSDTQLTTTLASSVGSIRTSFKPFASPSAVSGLLTFPANSLPSSAGVPSSTPSTSSSHRMFEGPWTDGKFPTTNPWGSRPWESTTVLPTTSLQSTSSATSIVYSISTLLLTATPAPVPRDLAVDCKRFYEVKSGDTCDGICTGAQVPSKKFMEWNPSVGTECTDLIVGDWVCVGL